MIRTKVIKTGKAEILVIGGLPQDCINIAIWERNDEMSIHDLRYQRSVCHKKELVGINLPSGKWKLLGKLEDIQERQWAKIVDYEFHEMTDEIFYRFYNVPCDDDFNAASAKESGLSLIESEEPVFTNPIIFVKNDRTQTPLGNHR